jgi:hypothetical protein
VASSSKAAKPPEVGFLVAMVVIVIVIVAVALNDRSPRRDEGIARVERGFGRGHGHDHVLDWEPGGRVYPANGAAANSCFRPETG